MLSYDFDEIDHTVRHEIDATAARFNAALEDLRARITPLHDVWTRDAAGAYRVEQLEWQRAATALNQILVDLGAAVRDGAADVADADRRAAAAWGR